MTGDQSPSEYIKQLERERDTLQAELALVAHFVSMKHPNETPTERQLRYERFLMNFSNPEWRAATVRVMNTPAQNIQPSRGEQG